MAVHPAERLLALFAYLLGRQTPADRERIRSSVESYRGLGEAAFERTFERDKAALREAGIPLETVRLPDGPGYRLRRADLWLEEEHFDARERLLLGLASTLWEEPEHRDSAHSVVRRLGLEPGATAPEQSGGSSVPESVRPELSADRRVATALAALTRGEELGFDYRPAGSLKGSPRRVRPWGLGHRFGHWYLTGWDFDRRAERTFRLSRAEDLESRRGTGPAAPADFRMSRALERVSEAASPEVGLRVSASGRGVVLDWLEDGRAVLPAPGPVPEDPNLLRLAVVDLGEFARCLAELPAPWTLVPGDCLERRTGNGIDSPEDSGVRLGPRACAEIQDAAADLVRAARELQDELLRLGAGTDSLPGDPPRGSRRREPVSRRFLRLTDLLSVLSEGPTTVSDLAAATGVRPAVVRRDLELVDLAGASFYGTTDFGVSLRGEVVSLDRAAVARPLRIAPEDALRLILGVLALESLTGDQSAAGGENPTDEHRDGLGALVLRLARFLPQDLGGSGIVSVQEEQNTRHLTERLGAAAERGRRVRIGYRSRGSSAVRHRTVLPMSLRRASGRWYLDTEEGENRKTFRLDGITEAEDLPEGVVAEDGVPDAGPRRRTRDPRPDAVGDRSGESAQSPPPAAEAAPGEKTVVWIAADMPDLADRLDAEPLRELAMGGRPGALWCARLHRRTTLARLALHEGGNLGFWSEPDLLDEWLADRTR